jgi:hypothetical protein
MPSHKYKLMADPALDFAVEVVRDGASLARIIAQWEDLAGHALEPNPLYEPGMMLPALNAPGHRDFHCCLLWVWDPERSDLPATLGGLFPFHRERRYKGFPATTLRSWSHPSWAWELCTPLVRTERAQQYVAALLDWLGRDGAAVVEFRHVQRDGSFGGVLADVLRDHKSTPFAYDVAAPAGQDGPRMHNLVIGLGALGEMWVSMLPLVNWTKRRVAAASRADSPAVTAQG